MSGFFGGSTPASKVTGLTANRIPIVNGSGVLTTTSDIAFNDTTNVLDITANTTIESASGEASLSVSSNVIEAENSGGGSMRIDDSVMLNYGDHFVVVDNDAASISRSGGASVAITTIAAVEGPLSTNSYFNGTQGTDIASPASNNLDLGNGNSFVITGTNNITYIKVLDPQGAALADDYEVTLFFTGTLTVNHNGGSAPSDYVKILLSGAANLSTASGNVLRLKLSTKGGVRAWRQVGSAVVVA